MGRRQARCFRPTVDSLEVRQVMSTGVSDPIVHTAIAPVAVPIATYNNTFTQISNAFNAYEGPYDDVLNALGSVASTIVSTVTSSNSSNGVTLDPGDNGSYVQGSTGDPGALEGRLETALEPVTGGKTDADALITRTFLYGGLTTSDAPYFQSKLTAMVKRYVTTEIKRGEMVLTWPGEAHPSHR